MWIVPKLVITWYRFASMIIQPVQLGQISPYDDMGISNSIPAKRDRFPPGICLQKLTYSHRFKNVYKMMKFFKDICLLFFLTKWRHMRRKNTIIEKLRSDKLVFIFNYKDPNFSLHILIFEPHDSLLLRNHNVNTSFYRHVLCHPANSKSDFFFN